MATSDIVMSNAMRNQIPISSHTPTLHPTIGWRRGQRHGEGNAMSGATVQQRTMYDGRTTTVQRHNIMM